MKIAIQGHPTRGKEIIQILRSLGGKTREELTGRRLSQYYFINCNGDIDLNLRINLLNHKLYTLEEFEKEFPFKVGDKVIHKEFNDFFEVISFNPGLSYPYKIKGVCEFSTKSHVLTKWQPKMKEERFVTLTLDKAKEWYKKGGELREIALQAFTKDELNPLPRSWKEFCEKYPVKKGECWIGTQDTVYVATNTQQDRLYKSWIQSKKSAEAHLAMIQLEQLRNCWWNGWEPIWDGSTKHSIKRSYNKINIVHSCNTSAFLAFPTREMAEEFLECFKDLIEKAGDLI